MNNDIINPTPVDTPPPATSAPIETDPIAFAPEPIITTPKTKSKLPIIIGAIVGVILVAGGVFGALWFFNYTKPETIALDAMTNLLNAKSIQAEGSIKLSLTEGNFLGITSIKLDLNTSSSLLPTSFNSVLTFVLSEEDEVSLGLDSTILSDGSIYFQTTGLAEVIESSLRPEIITYFEEELDGLDGQWYELDLVEIATAIGVPLSTLSYDCTINAINSLNARSARTAFVDTYKTNPFISVDPTDTTKADGNGYRISIDSGKVTTFANTLYQDGVFFEFEECSLAKSLPSASAPFSIGVTPEVILYVSTWGHELKAIDISYAEGGTSIIGNLTLSFPDKLSIDAPSDALPATNLIQSFITKSQLPQDGLESDLPTDDL